MRKALLTCLILAAPLAAAEDKLLDWMDRIAEQQLAKREAAIAKIRTVADAQARQQAVRARILELIGGLPDYDGPLNARVTGRIDEPRYVIEKVIFESLPRYYVTANLYRPKASGKYPGVLLPLGHWDQGKPAVQQIAANLALKGFVVLVYDPMGQGERQQAYDKRIRGSLAGGSTIQHTLAGAQSVLAGESFARYRIWDAKRALDYLVSRPEVETSKIGCTGCSGGGTLTTYISALDARITVAAPACYINTWHRLFPGPTGDSEQSVPGFLAAGFDVMDYIELFAPKPWLISSTVDDFFPIQGARYAYDEAQRWYRVFGAEDKVKWAIGPGGHGTPLQVREAIYEWFIRWLKDGKGNPREEETRMIPDFDLYASESGQVGGRETWEVIREGARKHMSPGTQEELVAELRRRSPYAPGAPVRVVSENADADLRTRQIAVETEPGIEITGTLYLPRSGASRPALLLVDWDAAGARALALQGSTVLNLLPRGVPMDTEQRYLGDWLACTRAWLIGRDMAGMRAADIRRGVDVLAGLSIGDVRAAARGVEGFWLLAAAALDPRITRVWLDRTPYSLRAAWDEPLSRNLHAAVIPGFALHWDMGDMVKALGSRTVIWSDPTDWLGEVAPRLPGKHYRAFEEGDGPSLRQLLQ